MQKIQPLDDLMQPTLQRFEPPGGGGGPRPWRLWAQFYMAVLGGPTAATIAAWINSGRLDMPRRRRLPILAVGVTATFLGILLISHPALAGEMGRRTDVMLGWRAYGALLFGVLFLMQKSADRLYQVNARPMLLYSRPFVAGVMIVIAAVLLNAFLVVLGTEYWKGAS